MAAMLVVLTIDANEESFVKYHQDGRVRRIASEVLRAGTQQFQWHISSLLIPTYTVCSNSVDVMRIALNSSNSPHRPWILIILT